jgi:hypothetical protein
LRAGLAARSCNRLARLRLPARAVEAPAAEHPDQDLHARHQPAAPRPGRRGRPPGARKNPQPFLDVERFSALEAERKQLQTRTEELQARRNA